MTHASRIIENLAAVRQRITDAARRAGRSSAEISLVAVTKYVPANLAQHLIAAGCHDLGENRPQELWAKAQWMCDHMAADAKNVRWHQIGHLQRNKVARTAPLASLIHSGDSLRILEAINETTTNLGRRNPALIEVNISGDATKHGFRPDEVEPNLANLAALESLEIRGLMCMASREGDLEQSHREFAALRQLRDRLQKIATPNITLSDLSMGMSGDFEAAIEEGATIVRIGSALFEGIELQ